MKRNFVLAAATFVAIGLMGNFATAEVIFSDAFERTLGNSDPNGGPFLSAWGTNDNGLSGTVLQPYVTTPTRTSGGGVNQTVQEADADGDNEGVVRFGAASTTYDLTTDANVLAAGGFTVDVDVTRGNSGFAAVFFGLDPATVATTSGGAAFLAVNATADATFLVQNNGGAGRIQFNTFGGGAINFDGIGFDPTVENSVSIAVSAPDGFDAGDVANFAISVNGTFVTDQDVTLDGGFAGNIGFSANTGGALYDNLVVSTLPAVPEPASFVMAGLAALGMIGRRRRSC